MLGVSPHIGLYRYWNKVRVSQPTPTRAGIEPMEIVPLLPFIALIERRPDGYRWRLIGTAIAEHFGRDLTGEAYGAHFLPRAFVDETIATFDAAFENGVPFFDEFIYRSSLGLPQAVARLVCPLAEDERHPPMVIHTRTHKISGAVSPGSILSAHSWGELRNRQPISSADQLQHLTDAWSSEGLR